MNQRLSYLFLLCILTQTLWSQSRHDHIWLFGNGEAASIESDPFDVFGGSAVDFNAGDTAEVYRQFIALDFDETNAVICDSAGQLQLYSNGDTLVNGIHQVVVNGTDLSPTPGYSANLPQGAMLLPHPGLEGVYVLFNAKVFFFSEAGNLRTGISPLYYHLVDVNAAGGRGAVTAKNQVAATDTLVLQGALTAVKHANGRDWWVFSAAYAKPRMKRLLLTPQGVEDWGYAYTDSLLLGRRGVNQSVFSPDGQFFAYASYADWDYQNLTLLHFDRCTGELSHFRRLHYYLPTGPSIGAAFSENSRFLYLAFSDRIYQYDLWAGDNWPATEDTVAVYDGFQDTIPGFEGLPFPTHFSTAQLAPNGEIWLNANSNNRYLSVIRQPNLPGDSCQVAQHTVMLPTITRISMPNLPYPRLGPLEGSPCDTLRQPPTAAWSYMASGPELAFRDESYHDIRRWAWSFGDGAIDTLPHPVHTYAQAGAYEVCLSATNPRGTDTRCQTIQVTLTDSEEPAEGEAFSCVLFPNPARGSTTLRATGLPEAEAVFVLRDALGREVVRQVLAPMGGQLEQSLSLAGLAAGSYWYELWCGGKLSSGKVEVSGSTK